MGEYLPPVVTELTGNASDLIAAIELGKAAMRSFKDEAQDMRVRVGVSGIIGPTAGAIAQIEALKAAMADIGNTEIKIATDANIMGNATAAATARAAGGFRVFGLGAMTWLKIIHNLIMVFSANLIADTAGIIAFGAAAAQTLGPVFQNISNLGKAWDTFSGAQKVAAENTSVFMNNLQNHDVQILAVYDSLLGTISQHMRSAGSVTDQATFAFMKFAVQVRSALGSPEWQRLIGGSSGEIGTDLSALLTTIGRLGNALVSLAHNFNFLGLWALSGIGMLAKGIVELNNLDPGLVRMILLTISAYHAWTFLSNLSITRFFANAISGLMGVNAALAATDAEMSTTAGLSALSAETNALGNTMISMRVFGLMPTLSLLTGLGAGALAAAAGVTGLVAVELILSRILPQGVDHMAQMISHLTAMDHATGLNTVGYQKLADQLGNVQKQM